MAHEDFEKLGVFYLGRLSDKDEEKSNSLLMYESKDLLTHGVCIGMTGSGKTGLCLTLLEEAAIDSIPVIAIDPKGDLGNLLLTFPDLRSEDFLPWVSADEARREQISLEDLAKQKAELWRKGLAEWGQSGQRIRKLQDSAQFAIYTPGSSAGLSVSILGSLDAPPQGILEDDDLLRERITNVATCLLTLLGVSADPLKSREHILLANLVDRAWRENRSVNLLSLIQEIQNPPMKRIGALDLETFFPKKERGELALSLNNLLAAPGFEAWLKGQPLNVEDYLYSHDGKPKISIFSIAHLSDTERMFFVTLLLNQVLSWMRTQSGSTSLRAILYMDEIYGYFPPVSNPPSKTPLLTLLKQARAYGLGVLLASQNSVDLDYKGLANAGTWFIGRLQTERDKMRLLDGLEGAAAESGKIVNRQDLQRLLGRLRTRLFLMNNIHEDKPVVFETRWTLSYLFGPLARAQIKKLMAGRKSLEADGNNSQRSNGNESSSSSGAHCDDSRAIRSAEAQPPPADLRASGQASRPGIDNRPASKRSIQPPPVVENSAIAKETPGPNQRLTQAPPSSKTFSDPNRAAFATANDTVKNLSLDLLPAPAVLPGIDRPRFLPAPQSRSADESIIYKPAIYAAVNMRFSDQKAKLDFSQSKFFVTECGDGLQTVNWNESAQIPVEDEKLLLEPSAGAKFIVPPAAMTKETNFTTWKREFKSWALGSQKYYLLRSPSTGAYSNPGETERAFRQRLVISSAEKRDAAVQKLKEKYGPKLSNLEERIRKAQAAADQAALQAREHQVGAYIDIGATVLGAIVGRKPISTRSLEKAKSAAREMQRAQGKTKSVEQNTETLESLREQLQELDALFRGEVRQIEMKFDPVTEAFEPVPFTLKQTNIAVSVFIPVWLPYGINGEGILRALWR